MIFQSMIQNEQSKSYRILNDVIAIIILLSVLALILESVDALFIKYHFFFAVIEIIFLVIFLLEYIARIAFAKRPLRYIFSVFGVIDLLAFLPSLIILVSPAFVTLQSLRVLRIIRIIRLLRLFRILKLLAYSRRRKKFKESDILRGFTGIDMQIYFFALFSLITIAGTIMYLVEGGVNDQFANIPLGMWWATVTVTTVGYGDIVPITILGRMVAGLTMVFGLIMFALLITVMGRVVQITLFGTPLEDEDKIVNGLKE